MVITALLKLDWLQTMLSAYKTQNKDLLHSFNILLWAEAKHIEATAAYSNAVWQEVIQPRDTSIEVNKSAPTAEGTRWSHSTTLLPFMSSPESDAQTVRLSCWCKLLWRFLTLERSQLENKSVAKCKPLASSTDWKRVPKLSRHLCFHCKTMSRSPLE